MTRDSIERIITERKGVGLQPPTEPNGQSSEDQKTQHNLYSWLRLAIFGILQDFAQRPLRRDRQQQDSQTLFSSKQEGKNTKRESEPILISTNKVTLRRSVFILILNLLSIELFFDLLYIALRIPAVYMHIPQWIQARLVVVYFFTFIIVNILKVCFMFYATLKWLCSTYQIGESEIRSRSGIISHKEKIFICSHTQEVTYKQGVLGRVFNYGSIELYDPALNGIIYLERIPNPAKYVEIIKKRTTDSSNAMSKK